jgi:hypothetical protein
VGKGVSTSFRFTRTGLHQIDKAFALRKRAVWPADLLNNPLRILVDSLESYTSYLRNPEFTKQSKYKFYYRFSQPVFLRSDLAAIFRMAEMISHSAGHDFVFIFLKEPRG